MMSKRLKRLWKIVTTVTLVVAGFTGCQLADKSEAAIEFESVENKELANKDILIGAFFSIDDLFVDEEIYLTADNVQEIMAGEEIEIDNAKVEDERIYAVKKEMTSQDGYTHESYVFEGCDGVAAFSYLDRNGVDMMPYITGGIGSLDSASDLSVEYKSTDDNKQEVNITGNIIINKYAAENLEDELIIHTYTVYETPTGEVYLTDGSSFVATGSERFLLEDSLTSEILGQNATYSTKVDVGVKVLMPAEKTILTMLNADNKVIGNVEIDNADIPESVQLEKNTSYVMVEEYIGDKMVGRYSEDIVFEKSQYSDEEKDEYEYLSLPINNDGGLFLEQAEVELAK